jgi:hypothetical protein
VTLFGWLLHYILCLRKGKLNYVYRFTEWMLKMQFMINQDWHWKNNIVDVLQYYLILDQ